MNTTETGQPLPALSSEGLGPLPESRRHSYDAYYSAEQMRAYAAEQVAAERERLARLAESNEDSAGFHTLSASEIRAGAIGA